ncbi:MAG: hydantoinase B/oxoprolinase family protein [Ferrovibrio sp.]|uniref:hydantoinase B/oxoprolinase family protein n=1 Tax=Ferrovibrio sp. TaxID=1917215 RepID=UPI002615153D|nr:hydantoinase B/oxoprolinase family protein [Ferrovibrio sp.]MCW0235048.1 hydantoinase B/oxoprolinase family protein [Ferrovibrio sp.]
MTVRLPSALMPRLEPVRLTLQAAADRMQDSLIGGAYSAIAREAGDGAAALFLPDGRLLVQARSLPLLLGSLIPAVEAVLKQFSAAAMREGEGYLLNDPFMGGTHLPDLTLVRPVFLRDILIGFTAASLHHQDVGGITPGSIPPHATSIFQEGLRLPPVQSHRDDRLDPVLKVLFEANSRTPDLLLGDLSSQWSATSMGGRELQQLAIREGEYFPVLCNALIDQTEILTRQALLSCPDGIASWKDALDSDGVGDEPVPIRVTLEKRGDRLRIDFTGSAPQTRGPVNAAPAAVLSAALYFMRSLVPDAPNNAGCLLPLDLLLPEGSVVNPRWPAAVNARTGTVKLACNAIIGAWSRIAPDTAVAANAGVAAVIAFAGKSADGRDFALTEVVASGAGAHAGGDGTSGVSTDVSNARNTPIEIVEARTPIRIEHYGFATDSGGGGRHRGGDGLRRVYRLADGSGTVSYRGERHRLAARGAAGGAAGAVSRAWIERADGRIEALGAKAQFEWQAGDRLHVETAGAGGWGESE